MYQGRWFHWKPKYQYWCDVYHWIWKCTELNYCYRSSFPSCSVLRFNHIFFWEIALKGMSIWMNNGKWAVNFHEHSTFSAWEIWESCFDRMLDVIHLFLFACEHVVVVFSNKHSRHLTQVKYFIFCVKRKHNFIIVLQISMFGKWEIHCIMPSSLMDYGLWHP